METPETRSELRRTWGVIGAFGECRKSTSSVVYFSNRFVHCCFIFGEQEEASSFPERGLHLGNPREPRPRLGGIPGSCPVGTAGFQGPRLAARRLVGTGPSCLGFRGPGVFFSARTFPCGGPGKNCLNLGGLGGRVIKSGGPKINVQKKLHHFVEGKKSPFPGGLGTGPRSTRGPREVILNLGTQGGGPGSPGELGSMSNFQGEGEVSPGRGPENRHLQ